MTMQQYPMIAELFRGYLNEDYFHEYGSADEAVTHFFNLLDRVRCGDAIKQLEQILEENLDDQALHQLISQNTGLSYYYQSNWSSPRAWLREIVQLGLARKSDQFK